MHNALHEIDAIEALTDEPRGQAMLDPWFRAQQMLRVASKGHGEGLDARKTTLYMFEGPKPSYMLVLTGANHGSSMFNLWLDEHMAPSSHRLSAKRRGLLHWKRTGIAWEHTRPLPTTVQGWKESLEAMDTMGDGIFQSLLSGRCRATSPSETLEAIEKWAHGTTCMKEMGQRLQCQCYHPFRAMGIGHMDVGQSDDFAMQSLLPAIDPRSSASQLDAWRQLLVLSNTQTKMPDFRLDGEQFGALLNT